VQGREKLDGTRGERCTEKNGLAQRAELIQFRGFFMRFVRKSVKE